MISDPEGIQIPWENDPEAAFVNLKIVFSVEKFLNCPYWGLLFTVHTDASDKKLGAVIFQNNKPIEFFKTIKQYTT